MILGDLTVRAESAGPARTAADPVSSQARGLRNVGEHQDTSKFSAYFADSDAATSRDRPRPEQESVSDSDENFGEPGERLGDLPASDEAKLDGERLPEFAANPEIDPGVELSQAVAAESPRPTTDVPTPVKSIELRASQPYQPNGSGRLSAAMVATSATGMTAHGTNASAGDSALVATPGLAAAPRPTEGTGLTPFQIRASSRSMSVPTSDKIIRSEEKISVPFRRAGADSGAALMIRDLIWQENVAREAPSSANRRHEAGNLAADRLITDAGHAAANLSQTEPVGRAHPGMSAAQPTIAPLLVLPAFKPTGSVGDAETPTVPGDSVETHFGRGEALAPARALQPATGGLAPGAGQAVITQLAEQISSARQSRIEISLAPEELGKVKISLHPTDNRMQISIMSERPETQDLLRRNAGDLIRELRALGFDVIDLDFADRREDQPMQRNPHGSQPGEIFADIADTIDTAAPARRVISGALDLRI